MMLRKALGLASVAALLAFAFGCETSERPRMGPPRNTTPGDVSPEARAGYDSLEGYSYDQRSEFRAKAEEALNKLDRKIDEWKMKSRQAAADTREAWDTAIADLRMKRENLRQSFSRMRDATAETWDELKAGFRRSWEDLEDSFERASAKFH